MTAPAPSPQLPQEALKEAAPRPRQGCADGLDYSACPTLSRNPASGMV